MTSATFFILCMSLAMVGVFLLGFAVGYGIPRKEKPIIRYRDVHSGRFVKGMGPK